MSVASTALSRATNRAYAIFGESALFTARDETTRECTVLLDHNLSQYGDIAQVSAKSVVVAVRLLDVPEMPRKGDLFEITSGKYAGRTVTVSSVVSSDEFEHKALAS